MFADLSAMLLPRVSIGVPVRNGGELFVHAVQSVLNQTEQRLEIIISDNASTDGTADYIRHLARCDPRIRIFHQDPPISAYDNFHFVLSKAASPYFMWAAHDDRRDPNFVAKLADKLDACPEAILAFGDLQIIAPGDHQGWPQPFMFSTVGLGRLARLTKASSLQCFHIYGLWRTEALRRIPYAYCSWWADLPMMMAAAWMGIFAYVPGTRFYYYEVIKSSAERVKCQDHTSSFLLPVAVLQMVAATFSSCCQIGGPLAGVCSASLVLTKQIARLPGYLSRRLARLWSSWYHS